MILIGNVVHARVPHRALRATSSGTTPSYRGPRSRKMAIQGAPGHITMNDTDEMRAGHHFADESESHLPPLAGKL